MEINSPLEELSEAYKCEGPESLGDSWDENILDDTKNKILYIVPAGFSQSEDRKNYYRATYEKAVTLGSEKKSNPFGVDSHSVILQPDPTNPYDKFAIQIGIRFDESNYMPKGCCQLQIWKQIGYVPKRVSKLLTKNFKLLQQGSLYSVHAMFDKNLYYVRVAIPYGHKESSSHSAQNRLNAIRFKGILED